MITFVESEEVRAYFIITKQQMLKHYSNMILADVFEGRLDGVIAVMNILDPEFAEKLLEIKQS